MPNHLDASKGWNFRKACDDCGYRYPSILSACPHTGKSARAEMIDWVMSLDIRQLTDDLRWLIEETFENEATELTRELGLIMQRQQKLLERN